MDEVGVGEAGAISMDFFLGDLFLGSLGVGVVEMVVEEADVVRGATKIGGLGVGTEVADAELGVILNRSL